MDKGIILSQVGQLGSLVSMAKRHTSFEIGSIIPSLAKGRFRQYDVLEALCRDFSLSLSEDVSKGLFEPKYLKVLLERLISLDFQNYENPSMLPNLVTLPGTNEVVAEGEL